MAEAEIKTAETNESPEMDAGDSVAAWVRPLGRILIEHESHSA